MIVIQHIFVSLSQKFTYVAISPTVKHSTVMEVITVRHVGLFVLVMLVCAQSSFFAISHFRQTHLSVNFLLALVSWQGVVVGVLSVLLMILTERPCVTISTERTRLLAEYFKYSTIIWAGYAVLLLVPSVALIVGFHVYVDDFFKQSVSSISKRALCMTPFMLILLINTADGDRFERCREQMWYLSIQMATELLDITGMLCMVVDAKEKNSGLSQEFETAMTAVACFAYMLTPLQMEEAKLVGKERKTRYKTTLIRNVLHMIGVDLLFLIFRMALEHGKDNSIYLGISKNIIGIFCSMWTISNLCKLNSRDN